MGDLAFNGQFNLLESVVKADESEYVHYIQSLKRALS